MNSMHKTIIALATLAVGSLLFSPAMAQDPTQSRWYRGTQWVDPTYRTMNRIMRVPPSMVPRRIRPHYRAFRGGWNTGRRIERRFRTGDRLYNYLQRRR